MATKLIVGFRTRAVEQERLGTLVPDFSAPKSYVDPEKIEKYVAEKKAQFVAEAADMPYLGTFETVAIADPANKRFQTWQYKGREPGSGKQPICLAVGAWLVKHFPTAWSWEQGPKSKPEVVFVGFGMRHFLKMLGTECSLPEYARPLPLSMWYGNSDHRDIGDAICPPDYKLLTFKTAVHRRRPADKESAAKWDSVVGSWSGPHADPSADVWLATELAAQLGFFREN